MNPLHRILWVSLSLLQALDVLTTYLIFTRHKGAAREVNPIVRSIVEQGQWLKLCLIKAGGTLIPLVILSQKLKRANHNTEMQREVSQVLLACNALMLLVVINNTFQFKKMQRSKKRLNY